MATGDTASSILPSYWVIVLPFLSPGSPTWGQDHVWLPGDLISCLYRCSGAFDSLACS
ncbi:hypothetical protein PF008_g19995 [Phytophthora fragariae]|uniref:Uncharacterized protein n=1 Tax=Phytophthora fragariae TaxID=53985 RepID=A0A6G0R212_9STRA|nr:hypothetical protein PF008_g19995 [Phytophthora fragariae]